MQRKTYTKPHTRKNNLLVSFFEYLAEKIVRFRYGQAYDTLNAIPIIAEAHSGSVKGKSKRMEAATAAVAKTFALSESSYNALVSLYGKQETDRILANRYNNLIANSDFDSTLGPQAETNPVQPKYTPETTPAHRLASEMQMGLAGGGSM